MPGIVLVERRPFHQVTVLLHEAAAAKIRLDTVAVPLERVLANRPIEWRRATVTGLDRSARRIHTDGGHVTYSRLVVALGSEVAASAVPGAAEHALTLTTQDDARRLRE
ncbi:MAG: FAD-dependent oxidoreductase, partial [Chloroflexi bacterium]|nr:FAD-dependent oxidoreductase [Chloroflexota bacterium]